MGRKKVHIQFIPNADKRFITFTKRTQGLFKKVHDLKKLTGAQIFVFVNYGSGEHLRLFSMTGTYYEDVNAMNAMMNMAENSGGASSVEVTTEDHYVPDQGLDKNQQPWLQWKLADDKRISFVSDPLMRINGLKNNSRIAKFVKQHKIQGTLGVQPNGVLLKQSMEPVSSEKNLLKPKPRRRKNRDRPIVDDDDEIREAVGELPLHARKRKAPVPTPESEVKRVKPTPSYDPPISFPAPPPTPTLTQTVIHPAPIQQISVAPDGTVKLSQTDTIITHKDVRIKATDFTNMASKFGFNANGSAPVFSFAPQQIKRESPQPRELVITPTPPTKVHTSPSPSPTFSSFKSMIPGVDGESLEAFLNSNWIPMSFEDSQRSPSPPLPLEERRFMERQARMSLQMSPILSAQNLEPISWEGLYYGSNFINGG